MLALLLRIAHLPPPTALVKFQLQAASPIFNKPVRYGLKNIRPHHLHRFLRKEHPVFYYDYEAEASIPQELLARANREFGRWSKGFNHMRPAFEAHFQIDGALVSDERSGVARQWRLGKAEARILKI